MNDDSRLIFISKDQKNIREFHISRVKLFSFISIFLIVFTVSGKLGMDYLVDFSHNSKIKRLERTNLVLQNRLNEMKSTITGLNKTISKITKNDDHLRTVLGLKTISSDIREVGIGGAKYDFKEVDEVSGFDGKIKLSDQLVELSKLQREVKLELKSYSELLTTFKKKQDSIAYLPALRPLLSGYISSGFGRRLHPILKVYKHHDGIDISAHPGAPILATANGVVAFCGINGGYGKMVIVDHKYGFQTRYGHMRKILVRKGQKVKRGDKIGEVGDTGLSTGPHLHYEVRFHGKPVNPRSYWFDDIELNKEVVDKELRSR